MLKISIIEDKHDFEYFLKLPWQIYKGNQYWVPPLLKDVKETLDINKNPFWHHAERELYIARDNDKCIGRIAAIVDNNHNSFHEDKIGFFGFFECIENQEVANALWDSAKNWLKGKNMDTMRGPVNPSMNDENAFLLEGFDMPPTIMMPYTHKYYLGLAESYGFKKAKDLFAFYKHADYGMPERIEKMINRVRERTKVKIRPFSFKHFSRDTRILKDIYNAAWEKNWGFVPMTEEEMDLMSVKLKQFADPDIVLFAEIGDEPIGVTLSLPDLNQVLKHLDGKLGLIEILKFLYYKNKIDGIRSLVGGVKKEYRETGIVAVLFYETEKAALKKGYKWCELGWNLEDNDLINKFDTAIGGRIYKKYRIYEIKI